MAWPLIIPGLEDVPGESQSLFRAFGLGLALYGAILLSIGQRPNTCFSRIQDPAFWIQGSGRVAV